MFFENRLWLNNIWFLCNIDPLFHIKHLRGEKLCLYNKSQHVNACLWVAASFTGSLPTIYRHCSKKLSPSNFWKTKWGIIFQKLWRFFMYLLIQVTFDIWLKRVKSKTFRPPSQTLLVMTSLFILCGLPFHMKLYKTLSKVQQVDLGMSIDEKKIGCTR